MKRPISTRTPESIYLEYFNDWLTVSRMAEYYSISEAKLNHIINAGRKAHEKHAAKVKNDLINQILAKESEGLNSLEHTPEDWQQARNSLQEKSLYDLNALLKTFEAWKQLFISQQERRQ